MGLRPRARFERGWSSAIIIIITIIIIIITTNYCIVLFVLSMLILVIGGFTYPPTVHFKFITKCGKCCYKLRQLVYYKVRQVVSQCATILLLKKVRLNTGHNVVVT